MQREILPDSAEEVELKARSLLVQEYEREHYPIIPPRR
jgi:hypothetical protein